MKMQASLEFLLIGSAVAAMSLFLIGFYSKNLFSQTSALADIANSSPNVSYPQPPLFDYSQPTTTVYASYAASIGSRSEELAYSIGKPEYVTNITEFSHCANVGFYGHPLNVTGQCGTPNAWDYFAGYACPRSGAFCIIPQNTRYATEYVSGEHTYAYNFTLILESPFGTMSSEISSSRNSSPLIMSGQTIGHAMVTGVSSLDPLQAITLISNKGNYSTVNQAYYSIYAQNKNALYPMLAFYNGTGADDPTQLSIQEAVNTFAESQIRLVGNTGSMLPCTVSGGNYLCGAASQFLYLINVTLSPSIGHMNQTIYYLGSVINIRG